MSIAMRKQISWAQAQSASAMTSALGPIKDRPALVSEWRRRPASDLVGKITGGTPLPLY